MTTGNRRIDLLVVWVLSLLVSLLVGIAFYSSGKASDCKTGQIDGQCGLSTFLGSLYGASAGLLILSIATACVLIVAYRRRRAAREAKQSDRLVADNVNHPAGDDAVV